MKRLFLTCLAMFSLGLSVLSFPGLGEALADRQLASLQGTTIKLTVVPSKQTKLTSCGETVLAMAYDYAYPKSGIDEQAILTYAEMQGYYIEKKWPFTSPANMVKIIGHYTQDFSTGKAGSADQGLTLLVAHLQKGAPVIIDVTARLDDLHSGAHFVLVTGVSVAADNQFAVTIYYNDPLTGKSKASPLYGDGGIWNAWQHNGDPGGRGWWLSVPPAVP